MLLPEIDFTFWLTKLITSWHKIWRKLLECFSRKLRLSEILRLICWWSYWKKYLYTIKFSFLASKSCFNFSLSVSRALRSFSEGSLMRLQAFYFLLELGTSSLTSSWMIISIATSWFSSNSSARILFFCFFFCMFVTALLNTDHFFCRLLDFPFVGNSRWI